MLNSDPIKTHLSLFLTIKLDFFNPRSSNWEPVLETFRIDVDYLTVVSATGNKTNIIIKNSEIE
jgi:hypothetical protein